MSPLRNRLIVTAGAAAGLFLAALASSDTAGAEPAPAMPAIPSVPSYPSAPVAPANPGLPNLFQQFFSSPADIGQQLLQTTTSTLTGPPATPAQPPLATATLNMPPNAPGAGPSATGNPAGLPFPGDLSSVLPFPLPNMGGTSPAPTTTFPGAIAPSAPVAPVPTVTSPGAWMPVSGLP